MDPPNATGHARLPRRFVDSLMLSTTENQAWYRIWSMREREANRSAWLLPPRRHRAPLTSGDPMSGEEPSARAPEVRPGASGGTNGRMVGQPAPPDIGLRQGPSPARTGPMTGESQKVVQSRVLRLLEYLAAVRALREQPIRDIVEYRDRSWWTADLPAHGACTLTTDGAEPWLEGLKATVQPAPPVPRDVAPHRGRL